MILYQLQEWKLAGNADATIASNADTQEAMR